MELNKTQINYYYNNGFLILEKLFTEFEIDKLNLCLQRFQNHKAASNIVYEENGTVRSIFAPHKFEKEFSWLYKQKRIVHPAEQLLGSKLYLYQYKLNNKSSFDGDWWEWHQDFAFWQKEDNVKTPNMLSVMILLQDTNSYQGPLLLIPKSHNNGILPFENKTHLLNDNSKLSSLNRDLKYTVRRELVTKMVSREGIISCEGSMGTCIFFHSNIVHASNSNVSPHSRNTAIITYNDIGNIPKSTRPDFLCSKDFEPISS